MERLRLKLPLGSLLVRVTVFGLLDPTATVPKERLVGVAVSGISPVAVRFTICGELAALSFIVTSPERLPASVGVAITLIVHFFPVRTGAPVQLSVSAKSPLMAILATLSAPIPVLVTVTVLDELVVPTI
jgi:hypothetical protein